MTLWTAIVTCRTCKAELNRATGVPEAEKARIAISAPLLCLCEVLAHNTGSDFNLNFDLEWRDEPLLPEPE